MRTAKKIRGTTGKARKVQPPGFVKGASASLRVSSRELDDFLNGLDVDSRTGPLRDDYRSLLRKFADYWFRRGFRRGCIETHRQWEGTRKFPGKVTYDARRDFFDGRKRPVTVSWRFKS